MKTVMVIALLGAIVLQVGCQTPPTDVQKTAAIGTGIGAGLGWILANQFTDSRGGRALSAAAGGLVGGALGYGLGQQQDLQQQINYNQQQQSMKTIWIENSNGSKTPVVIQEIQGGQYIGPRGEYYDSLPTQEQLRKIYGM